MKAGNERWLREQIELGSAALGFAIHRSNAGSNRRLPGPRFYKEEPGTCSWSTSGGVRLPQQTLFFSSSARLALFYTATWPRS